MRLVLPQKIFTHPLLRTRTVTVYCWARQYLAQTNNVLFVRSIQQRHRKETGLTR